MTQKKTGNIPSTNNCKKQLMKRQTHNLLLVIGDLNAKVGNEGRERTMGSMVVEK